jgi:riboflavin synthase
MFTGIVEEVGVMESLSEVAGGWSLTVKAQTVLEGAGLGHSLAVNGVCLTVTAGAVDRFTVGLSPETLRRTNLGDLRPRDGVNLERPLAAKGRSAVTSCRGMWTGRARCAPSDPKAIRFG